MRRSYKFRLRPTARQHVALGCCLAAHRELYNAGLAERRDAYERVVRRSAVFYSACRPAMPVRYGSQAAQLSEIRSCRADIGVWSFSSQQATLRRLNKAFEAFFRRVKAGGTPGYPRFKASHRFDTVEWPKDGDGCRWHNQRRDFHHQTARRLVNRYDVICVEDLTVANMVRRAKPVSDPDRPGGYLPNSQAAKTGLNRSISDAGWAQFRSILHAKAEEAGRVVLSVNPRHTSNRCHQCGHTAKENRVTQAVFRCQACSHTAHADEHAARNILRAGLALPAADQAA